MGLPATTNALVWVFTTASIFVVTLRLVARLHLTKAAGWDDSVIVIALIINVLCACLASYAISQGVGHPLHALPLEDGILAAKWGAIADAFALLSFTVPKLSVAILLCRILSILINSRLKRFLLVLPAVLSIVWAMGNEGFWFGQCQPVDALWDKRIHNLHCLDPMYFRNQGIALCAFSAAADIFYALFPIFFVRKLNMSRSKKIHLACMLSLGVVGGIVAIWKTTQFIGISVPDADVTEASAHLIYATLIEANLLVVAACVPTVLPVARAWQNKAGAASRRFSANLSKSARAARDAATLAPLGRSRLHHALAADSARDLARLTGSAEAVGSSPTGPDDRARGRRGFPPWRYLETAAARGDADEEMAVHCAVEVSVVAERIARPDPTAASPVTPAIISEKQRDLAPSPNASSETAPSSEESGVVEPSISTSHDGDGDRDEKSA